MHDGRPTKTGKGFPALFSIVAIASAALVAMAATVARHSAGPRVTETKPIPSEHRIRYQLFEELRPVALANCQLERFGEQFDGGYLMCGNLLDGARAAYSYGISGYDGWGCDVAARLSTTTHQYDCFNLQQPACSKGTTLFHPLCIAGEAKIDADGRIFQSLEQQLADNEDGSNRVVVKMDVEGAEWESLLRTPDAVLQRIDQLVIELHGTDEPLYLDVVQKLKRTFHVAHVHANNYTCTGDAAPFPSSVYEVLFVNTRLGQIAEGARPPTLPHVLDSPNGPLRPNCVPRWN